MSDMICRKSMTRCLTPGMCSSYGGCQPEDSHMRAIRSLRGDCADLIAERDQLRAENERLNAENKQLIMLECNGGTAQAAVNLLTERDQLKAELEKAQLIGRLAYNFDGYKAVLDERDQLRAEVAGLKTGYEAYERVNAELKAECESLRKDAERWRFFSVLANDLQAFPHAWGKMTPEKMDVMCDQAIADAAMGKGEQL
ncbi:hypothetical protein JFT61_19705 [Pseudomonas fluorescens]|nr:hypothetical protein [Pseudomonas fluorescens]